MGNTNFEEAGSEITSADRFSFLELFDFLTREKTDRIEIITSGDPKQGLQEKYCSLFSEMGFSNFDNIHFNGNMEDESNIIKRISAAKTVFFVGDHSQTCRLLKDTAIIRLLYKKYLSEHDFTIAGLSLGAMCIPNLTIRNTSDDHIELAPGLGFLNDCIVDAQFVQQTKFKKLVYTVIQNRSFLGVGLSENTALVISKGVFATCKGRGFITIIDAKNVDQKSVDHIVKGDSVFADKMKGHILTDGCVINLRSGEVA